MPPINYCKGQRVKAWCGDRPRAINLRWGWHLSQGLPCSLFLPARFLFYPAPLSQRPSLSCGALVLSCKWRPPPLNPNILKFMSKYYVAGFSTQGLLKHPDFLWNHFQCRFNAHFGHEIQIFCFRKKALHILNRHGDFHCMVEIQPATSILKILEFSPSGIRLTCPTSKKQESHNLFIYSPNYQNKP